MALEISTSADSKSRRGIIGISQNPGALDQWFLTSHDWCLLRHLSRILMFTPKCDHVDVHQEASSKCVVRDEADVQKLISCFTTGLMSNPFTQEASRQSTLLQVSSYPLISLMF